MDAEQYEAIVKAAREREKQTAPSPWGVDKAETGVYSNSDGLVPDGGETVFSSVVDGLDGSVALFFSCEANAQLVTAAPDLQAALIAADDRIKTLEARVAELEQPYRYKIGEERLMRFATHKGHVYVPCTINGFDNLHDTYCVKYGNINYGNVFWFHLRTPDQLSEYDVVEGK